MREAKGNIFDVDCDAVCITTNGFVKTNGECVMGRGCALEASRIDPALPSILGNSIRINGNVTQIISERNGVALVAFPVKPGSIVMDNPNQIVRHLQPRFSIGDVVPGWAAKTDINLILRSAEQLVHLADTYNWINVVLPQPGCGAGELTWDNEVKPRLASVLDDRFTCMTF